MHEVIAACERGHGRNPSALCLQTERVWKAAITGKQDPALFPESMHPKVAIQSACPVNLLAVLAICD